MLLASIALLPGYYKVQSCILLGGFESLCPVDSARVKLNYYVTLIDKIINFAKPYLTQ